MPMKQPRRWLLAAAAAWLALPLSLRGKDTNILLVTIDTLRPDRLSCYSPKYVQTPRIDALASSGALFERGIAHVPLTLPSHASILTGLLPPKHGISENSKSIVSDKFPTLATVLKAAGYSTGAFVGSFALSSERGLTPGFDVYDDHYPRKVVTGTLYPERIAEKVIGPALEWLARQSGKWFLWVHLWDPHAPYDPPEPYASRFKNEPYAGEVAYVDAELGKLLDAVQKKEGPGKTLIILTGDHGESLGEHGEMEHGYFAYNSTIWIPLIIAGPEIRPSRVKEFVSHVDIFPTVCEVLGLKKPADLAGTSLTPLLKGRTRKSPPIYFESLDAYLNRGWAPLRGVIREGKKYIDLPIPELYDLAKDFDEASNLSPAADLSSSQKSLGEIMARDFSPESEGAGPMPSRETRERLRSLGYVSAPLTAVKKSYGPEDDLKTLAPLNLNLNTAARLSKAGKTEESIRLLEESIRARKDFSQAYHGLFQVYMSKGMVDEALASFERGWIANPKNYFLVAAYGVALVNSGRWEKSIEVLRQAISLYDQDAEVWDSLGLAYMRTGDDVKAKAHFEEALALAPSDPIYNNHMGSFYVTMGMKLKSASDIAQSVGYFNAAVAGDPALAAAYNGRAGAFRVMGRINEAIADWTKAVEIDPFYDLPVYNLAVVYLETGDKARALEFCQRYLSIKGPQITDRERKDVESLMQQCRK